MGRSSRFPWARMKRRAVIDIGTNTCLLLIGESSASGDYEIVRDEAVITQLGQGFYASGELRPEAMKRTLEAVSRFMAICGEERAEEIVVTGTSALRDAENGAEFVDTAQEKHGVEVEIIPGEEEARLSYLAVRRDDSLPIPPEALCIVADIGGGSTELTVGADRIRQVASLDVGSVRLTEMFLKNDPPAASETAALREYLTEAFEDAPPANEAEELIGVGGTITTLACIALRAEGSDRSPHGYALTLRNVSEQIAQFASMPTERRKQIEGLDLKRADVILAGALIAEAVMKRFQSQKMIVSARGLRYGVFLDRFVNLP